jgi:hypothetical protein
MFVGTPTPIPHGLRRSATGVIEGLGVSRAWWRGGAGGARPGDERTARAWEILVCAATDPSWVGHFLVAAALVIDVGGR